MTIRCPECRGVLLESFSVYKMCPNPACPVIAAPCFHELRREDEEEGEVYVTCENCSWKWKKVAP